MTILVYEDQSAEALRLNLVQGAVNKNELSVLCTGEIEVPYGSIEAGIIGASHYFEFINPEGQTVFTELFACKEIESENRVFYGNLHDASNVSKYFGYLTYSFKTYNLQWNQGKELFNKMLSLVQSSTSHLQFGLQFSFPVVENQKFPPITLVHVQADPDYPLVKIKTLHAYPNDGSLVFTDTVLKTK